MKKVVSCILVIAFVFTMCFQFSPPVDAATEQLKALPQTGSVISGFKTLEIDDMELINAKTVLFEHVKTGAKLVYIQNADTDKSFQIGFKTPANDNTGVNHIIEHAVVSGSQKYPLKDVLFTVATQTYNTFVNAFTAPTTTFYPVSSMSEDQLMKLADIYLDCVFNPAVKQDKKIFDREAWRYELSDVNAPLSLTGIVYNEMKGALGNIQTAATSNTRKALFPNSVQSNESGGIPENIKELTYKGLLDTLNTYYTPSNALIVLYGNLDYEKFLKFIDTEYLSKYEKKDVKIDQGKVEPFKEQVTKDYKFAVTSNANTKNASQLDYAYALTGISEKDIVGLAILSTILNQDTSPLKVAFNKSDIGGSISVSFDNSSEQAVLDFIVSNTDPSKKTELKKLVDSVVDSILKNGFDKEMVDAVMASSILGNSYFSESSNKGIILSQTLQSIWSTLDSTTYLNNLTKNMREIQSESKKDYFENLLKKYVKDNNHAALVATIPEAGLAEKNDKQEADRLVKIKSEMTKEELDAVVLATKEYSTWNTKKDDPNLIKSLSVVSPSSLPEEVRSYNIKEKTISGIRSVTTEADVSDTCMTSVLLNTSGIGIDKLHYLKLYTGLLGNVSTNNTDAKDLNNKIIRYLNGARFSPSIIPQKDSDAFEPYLSVTWMGLVSDYDNSLALVKEMLSSTNFTKVDEILNYVKDQKSSFKSLYDNNPLVIQINRSIATNDASAAYSDYIEGIPYYKFLTEVEQQLKSDPQSVITQLQSIADMVNNKNSAITMFAGSKAGIEQYEAKMPSLFADMKSTEINKQDYSKIPTPAKSEGIIANTQVQYNMLSASYDKMNTTYNGKFIPISLVIYDNYLTPKIRMEKGAYDNLIEFNEKGLLISSYRDPNVKETFEIFMGLPQFLKDVNLTQEDLDRYILKAYSQYSMPLGEMSGAINSLAEYLGGKTSADTIKVLKEIKSLNIEDIRKMSENMTAFLNNATLSTTGSENAIESNINLFGTVIKLDNEEPTAITRGDFIKLLLAGAPDPIQLAIQQKIINGDGKGNFYLDNKLTMQELAVFISRIIDLSALKKDTSIKVVDINDASKWAQDSITNLVQSGLIGLDSNGKFNPKKELASAEVQDIFAKLNAALTAMQGK